MVQALERLQFYIQAILFFIHQSLNLTSLAPVAMSSAFPSPILKPTISSNSVMRLARFSGPSSQVLFILTYPPLEVFHP